MMHGLGCLDQAVRVRATTTRWFEWRVVIRRAGIGEQLKTQIGTQENCG
jgi:hypothetical protein